MGDTGIVEAIRSIGPIGALLAILTSILASVLRAIISGALIPRHSHEDLIRRIEDRCAAAETREQWWRDKSLAEERINNRSIDLAADLATRRALSRPSRDGGQGAGDD